MNVLVRLESRTFDPAGELAELVQGASSDGAVVSFVGIARPATKAGAPVERMMLEHHPRLTLRSLEEIAVDAAARFDVSGVRVVHRCGVIAPGEPIVFAGACSVHRRPAFEAADYLMDRLKTEAVFWKREDSAAGSAWIEPTHADFADRGRWE
jgi:molybdopterin synthase catalytic subunit